MGQPLKSSYFVGCMNAMSSFAHILMGAAALLAFALIEKPNPPMYKAHVYITVIGTILSLNPFKGFQDNFIYPKKSKIYWIIQIIACTLILTGASLGINTSGHIIRYYPHGLVGIIAMVLTSVSLVGAIANLLLEKHFNSFMKNLYVFVGTLSIIMAYVTMVIQFDRVGQNAIVFGRGTIAITVGIVFATLPFITLIFMLTGRAIMT